MGQQESEAGVSTEESSPSVESLASGAPDTTRLVAELTQISSDFQNYRKRVDKQLAESLDSGKAAALLNLLVVLDDVELARKHNEVVGGFKSVAGKLDNVVATLGLSRFGEVGESFDPAIHEAVAHEYGSGVATSAVGAVVRFGYKFKGALLRPAQVLVIDPRQGSYA